MGIYDKSKTLVKHIVMAEMKLVSVDDMVDKLWGKESPPQPSIWAA
jgi:hypothetical protein